MSEPDKKEPKFYSSVCCGGWLPPERRSRPKCSECERCNSSSYLPTRRSFTAQILLPRKQVSYLIVIPFILTLTGPMNLISLFVLNQSKYI